MQFHQPCWHFRIKTKYSSPNVRKIIKKDKFSIKGIAVKRSSGHVGCNSSTPVRTIYLKIQNILARVQKKLQKKLFFQNFFFRHNGRP